MDYSQSVVDFICREVTEDEEFAQRIEEYGLTYQQWRRTKNDVWNVAAAAAQRMPKLKFMSLFMASPLNPEFRFINGITELGPSAQILWQVPHDMESWKPSLEVLRAWHATAVKKQVRELLVFVLHVTTGAGLHGAFPTEPAGQISWVLEPLNPAAKARLTYVPNVCCLWVDKAKLPPLPQVPAIKYLSIGAWDGPGAALSVVRLAEIAPFALGKELSFHIGQEGSHYVSEAIPNWHLGSATELELELFRDREGETPINCRNIATRHERSSIDLARKLYQISLGLKYLYLSPSTGIGTEIFGQDLPGFNDAATKWPSLKTFHFDYDQCIIDSLEHPQAAKLEYIANSDSEASHLWPLQDRVWEAAAAAAQRMPNLEWMHLRSFSKTGPEFEMTTLKKGEKVRIYWSWHNGEKSMKGDDGWRPSNKVLEAWRTFSKKDKKALEVVLIGKADGNLWEQPLPRGNFHYRVRFLPLMAQIT
ncbi:hypothetical protein PG993_009050 [Apiospora rasikravindrae]|uniref:DUF6546 domain-containing protein n=1 Tax=Apiospora rasikravindrae TaxID=990691 RepID=A0ABR1SK18_9PEZI